MNSGRSRIAKALVLFWLGLMVLALPGSAAGQFGGPAADEVRAREIAFAATMKDRDLNAFLSFVAPEAIFFNGATPLRGRDAIKAEWSKFFEGAEPPFSWTPALVQVLDSGQLALSSGPVVSPTGEVVGRFNSIWRKGDDGRWMVVFDKGS